MTDTLFEQLGGTYTQTGDYLLPDLSLPAEKEPGNVGVWALRHKRYLKQHHKVLYYNLLKSGKLDSYLADIEEQAQQLFLRLVKEYAEKEAVTEQHKTADPMVWVRQMNNIRNRATEIVNNEVIAASGRKNKNVRTGLCQNKIQYAYTSACRQLC